MIYLPNEVKDEVLKSNILTLENSVPICDTYYDGIEISGYNDQSVEIHRFDDKFHVYETPLYGGDLCYFKSLNLDEIDKMIYAINHDMC